MHKKIKENPCVKIPFHSRQSALKRIEQIKERDKQPHRKPVRAYKCPDCNKWHLTSMAMKYFKNTNKKTQQEVRVEEVAKMWEERLNHK